MPKVSIVVPVYNAELFLDNCVRSLVQQSYQNIEIILVDDGSSDNSKDVLNSWRQKDSRVICIHQENQGVTAARKNGVMASSGKWVSFVDADDELPMDAIESMVNASAEKDLVVGHVLMDLNWCFPKLNVEWTQKDLMHAFLISKSIHWGPCAKLFRRELLDEYVFDIPREITNGEDYIFNVRYATKVRQAKVIDKDVYHYIYREGSATSKNPFRSIRYCFLYEKEMWMSFKGVRVNYLYDYCLRTIKTIYRRFRTIVNRDV